MSTVDAPLPAAPALLAGPTPRILIVRAPYYRDVVDGLQTGAVDVLEASGAVYEVLDVAGAFELAQAIRLVVGHDRYRFAGFVALGCVVRGETDHYDFICAAAMNGLMQVALDQGVALGTGLLTVDTIAQAQARSGPAGEGNGHNKGAEAAVACLGQINVARRFMAGSHAG